MIREREKEGRQYKAALYMRLSKDDGTGESASINTQRSMLRSYADRNGFFIYGEYADDSDKIGLNQKTSN